MKKPDWLKIFRIVILNLIILFVLLELVCVGFFFIKTKQFFYLREKTPVSGLAYWLGISNLDEARLGEGIDEKLHPFFGYTMKPGIPYRLEFSQTLHKANNYGFISDYDYPFKKETGNQFIVGVFGGSVAENYAVFESENNILAKKLKQIPLLRNKEIIILSFALGGYKQPQQLLLLNYFLSTGQHFDTVINIDGFNEISLSNLNNQEGLEISMPSTQHVIPLIDLANSRHTAEDLNIMLKIKRHKAQLKKALQYMETGPLASCFILKWLYAKHLAKSYKQELMEFDKMRAEKSPERQRDDLIQVDRTGAVLRDAIAFERIASLWSNSSRQMHDVLKANKISYFHFIQPNQFYPTKRVFSEHEKKSRLIEENGYSEGARKGYPFLVSKINELKKSGINIYNVACIFDNIKDTVYIDNCCHYNQTGSEIFSGYIANSIAQSLAGKAKSLPDFH